MRKGRLIVMLLVALGMAFGASALANRWMQARMGPATEVSDLQPVVVAAVAIPFGQKLEAIHVKLVDLPRGTVPAKAFSSIEGVAGRVAVQSFYPGEILVEGRVVEHMGGSTLAAVIGEGKRAVAVRVDDVVGVAGFLLPGNRVDVVFARRDPAGRMVETETILQDLKVLAIDQTASPEKDGPVIVRAVTLEMTPAQAEVLFKATQEGKVQLTLRNPLDQALIARAEPEPAAPPAPEKPAAPVPPPVQRMTVIRGVAVTTSSVSGM
jgi:pilus assembly protein CpaB